MVGCMTIDAGDMAFTLRMDIRNKVTWGTVERVVSASEPILDEVQRAIGNLKRG